MAAKGARAKNAKRTAELKAQAKTKIAQKRHRVLLHEAHQEVADLVAVPARGVDPAIAIQDILDSLHMMWKYATSKVAFTPADEYFVDTIAGKIPNHWIREQERLGMQIVHVASKASAMGLAERAVRIHEAQAAMFATLLEAALTKHGVGMDDRRAIMDKVAQEFDTIDAAGVDVLERVA